MKTNRFLQPNLYIHLKSYGLVLLGSLVLALGYALFIVPHHIVPGGIFGLSIVIHELGGLSAGTIALLINIPLLLVGAQVLGRSAGVKTAVSMIAISVLIDLISWMTHKSIVVNDVLVSSIFGGILIGLAVFMVMRAGATTGGNDILVRILMRRIQLPYSLLVLIVDGAVVMLGVLVFGDLTLAAYCIIAIIAISKTIEHLMKQNDLQKTIMVFAEDPELLKRYFEQHPLVNQIVFADNKMLVLKLNQKNVKHIESEILNKDDNARVTVVAA